ncbi:ATPase, T2SS/T4P/T4SS family [Alicyclobacillus fodiniaquatilis]|uniref:ATPase, T2SS/T4P/T4SS family n=1 Tax=Alicyclobacillus fodiniaquatilis TaxID=1661150 RepID=A0ABW4JLQ9_9BACL
MANDVETGQSNSFWDQINKNKASEIDTKLKNRGQIRMVYNRDNPKEQSVGRDDEFQKQKDALREAVHRDIDFMLSSPTEDAMKARLMKLVQEGDVERYNVDIKDAVESLVIDLYHWGPLEALRVNLDVTDIQVYGDYGIRYFQSGERKWFTDPFGRKVRFQSIDALNEFVEKKLGENMQFNLAAPSIDAIFPDGSRINYKNGPVGVSHWDNGAYELHTMPILSIRIFGRTFSLDDLRENGMLTPRMRDYLQFMIEIGENFILGGNTGTGKSTVLGAMLAYTPQDHVTAITEDTPELQAKGFFVRLYTREANGENQGAVSIEKNVIDSKRMFFDSLIVGELRDGDTAFQGAQAAIMGSFLFATTIHAADPERMWRQYTNIMMSASTRPNRSFCIDQFVSAFNQLLGVKRVKGKRYMTAISEVVGMDDNAERVYLRPVFERKFADKTVIFHGLSEQMIERAYEVGVEIPESLRVEHGVENFE